MRRGRPVFDRDAARWDTLGAEFDGYGTNFALFSENATRVELCLFNETAQHEMYRLDLPEMEGGIWYGHLPGIGPGQVYAYRVDGPHKPDEGHRFNPNKLLLDPYARELRGELRWHDALFGYPVGMDDRMFDKRDSAPYMPKAVVVDPRFDWDADTALRHPWPDTVIYEAHVKGLTMRHPDVPKEDRGTFQGLASEAVIQHLHRLGVTAVELLPVHGFVNDRHLLEKGLSNYWGYNSLAFFAPHRPYLKTGAMHEAKRAIRRLHQAGIEVILDVVYNHTAEGSELGPTLSFRGIDNAAYYVLSADNPRHCHDITGTGNTLNVAHPMVLRMVLDSLRYWVQVMHVDGFRFDLAAALGRELLGFEREGAFFNGIRQDPVLSSVKLIAEPWDIGEGGYQVGGFPWPFREWNDKFRDDFRSYWRGDMGRVPLAAQRMTGSPVQFNHSHRPATSSINFLAAHDGFTLWDTLSYNEKHNDANGEDGQDGHNHNVSDNMGVEGATDDPEIIAARRRRARAMLASLFLSQGIPMLLAGDEFGQTQHGNNNAYCQDNEIAWLNWEDAQEDLIAVVADLSAFRRASAALRQRRFATAPEDGNANNPFVWWHHPKGREMRDEDWRDEGLACFGMELAAPAGDSSVLVILNAGKDTEFTLPEGAWRRCIDTSGERVACDDEIESPLLINWQSVVALVRQSTE